MPSSPWQRFVSWFTGSYAEFYDSKFVGQMENRDVTRVESTGICKVNLNMISKGMVEFGFTDGAIDEVVDTAPASDE